MLVRGDEAARIAYRLAESLRNHMPQLSMIVHSGGGSFKSQMRKADRSGAKIALILGESEIAAGTISAKLLREEAGQIEIPQENLNQRLADIIQS
jgi:histidyl-tRNA synthetase